MADRAANRKKRRAAADAEARRAAAEAEAPLAAEQRPRQSAARGWSTGHLLIVLVGGLTVGAVSGYAARGGGKAAPTEAATAPAETVVGPRVEPSVAAPTPAAGADKFGRPPGDEHFGHDHPTQQGAPAAAPAPGPDGKDSFGRAPGHEHFGHNHP